jgi:hypothetical protein
LALLHKQLTRLLLIGIPFARVGEVRFIPSLLRLVAWEVYVWKDKKSK